MATNCEHCGHRTNEVSGLSFGKKALPDCFAVRGMGLSLSLRLRVG